MTEQPPFQQVWAEAMDVGHKPLFNVWIKVSQETIFSLQLTKFQGRIDYDI